MTDMVSTLILEVELDCNRCYKKIKRTLCQLQEKEHIQSIVYDVKNGTVTVSGPFDPKRLIKKICSKACKVIKHIEIKEETKETKPDEEKPKEKPVEEKPKEKPAEEKPKEKPKDDEAKKDKPKAVESPVGCQPRPVCYCKPWEHYRNYRGCMCGCAMGYGGPSYKWSPWCPPAFAYGGPICGGGYRPKEKPVEEKPAEEKSKEKPSEEKLKEKPKDKIKQVKFTDPVEPKKEKPKAVESVPPSSSEPVKNDPRVFEMGPTEYQLVWPTGGPSCYCNQGGYYENYKGCTCGCSGGYGRPSYRWRAESPPMYGRPLESPPMYSGPSCDGGYLNYQSGSFFLEEDPQSICSIM